MDALCDSLDNVEKWTWYNKLCFQIALHGMKKKFGCKYLLCQFEVTFFIFLSLSVILSLDKFIGTPIECYIEGFPDNILNTFCWVNGTYTMDNG